MPQRETLRVAGYREFLAAADRAGPDSKKQVRGAFRASGDLVRKDATDRFGRISAKTAAGFRTYVRARGVSVEQSLRRTTGKRPDFGRTQMSRGLEPALTENETEVLAGFEHAMDVVADHFEARP